MTYRTPQRRIWSIRIGEGLRASLVGSRRRRTRRGSEWKFRGRIHIACFEHPRQRFKEYWVRSPKFSEARPRARYPYLWRLSFSLSVAALAVLSSLIFLSILISQAVLRKEHSIVSTRIPERSKREELHEKVRVAYRSVWELLLGW